MSDLSDALNRSASAQNVAAGAQVASAAAQAYAAHQMGKMAEAQKEANELTKLQLLEQQKEKERRTRAKELRVACLEAGERLEQLERLIASETDEKNLFREAIFSSVYIPLMVQMSGDIFEEFEDIERIKKLTDSLKRLEIPLDGKQVNLFDLPELVKAYTQPFYKAADDFLSRCEDIEFLARKNNDISPDAPEIWADKIPGVTQSALRLFEETEKMAASDLLIKDEGITDLLPSAKTLLAQEGDRPVLEQLKKRNFSLGLPEKSLYEIVVSSKAVFDETAQKTTTAKKNYFALAKQAKAATNINDKAGVKKILEEMAHLEKSFSNVEDEIFARKWFNNFWPAKKKFEVGLMMLFGGLMGILVISEAVGGDAGGTLAVIGMVSLLIGIPIFLSKK
jgi:hypothetical protein